MHCSIFPLKFAELDWTSHRSLQFTLSDFYEEWVEAYGKTSNLPNNDRFKALLLIAMDHRQRKLFSNNDLIATVFFDPRFTLNGSILFSASEKGHCEKFVHNAID